jgi:amino acid permease
MRGAYRPIRNGNIKGSVFAMLASALGTGCLNLPSRLQQLGIIPFILITFLCAFLSYLGMYMMECVIVKYKVASYA